MRFILFAFLRPLQYTKIQKSYIRNGVEPNMIDLHLHLDGSLSPEDISLLAKTAGVTLPCTDPEGSLAKLTAAGFECRPGIAATGDFDDVDMLSKIEAADIPTENPVRNLTTQQRKNIIGFNVSR